MKKSRVISIIIILVLVSLTLRGGYIALRGGSSTIYIEGSDPDLPTLNLYTHGQTTTPQLGLLAGIREGDVTKLFNIRIHQWKNPDELLSHVLIGQGDLWIGHTEGFALARKRGAPVRILAFTSSHKFFIITSTGAGSWKDLGGATVGYAPPGSPSVPLLDAIMNRTGVKLHMQPYQGRELALMVSSGRMDTAILPEPLVSLFLSRFKNLTVIGNVEDLFLETMGYPGILPVAAIAVNELTARKYPDKIARLQDIIIMRTAQLAKEGRDAARYFPPQFEENIPRSLVADSLSRDILLARRAAECHNDVMLYLRAVHPDLFTGDNPLDKDDTFLWK